MTFGDFIETVIRLRSHNLISIMDLTDLQNLLRSCTRKWLDHLEQLELKNNHLEEEIEMLAGHPLIRLIRSHPDIRSHRYSSMKAMHNVSDLAAKLSCKNGTTSERPTSTFEWAPQEAEVTPREDSGLTAHSGWSSTAAICSMCTPSTCVPSRENTLLSVTEHLLEEDLPSMPRVSSRASSDSCPSVAEEAKKPGKKKFKAATPAPIAVLHKSAASICSSSTGGQNVPGHPLCNVPGHRLPCIQCCNLAEEPEPEVCSEDPGVLSPRNMHARLRTRSPEKDFDFHLITQSPRSVSPRDDGPSGAPLAIQQALEADNHSNATSASADLEVEDPVLDEAPQAGYVPRSRAALSSGPYQRRTASSWPPDPSRSGR